MQLERITTEELIEKCRNVFYDHMASNEDIYVCGEFLPCTEEYPTVADMLFDFHQEILAENGERISLYEQALQNEKTDKECIPALLTQLDYLQKERVLLTNSCMPLQKDEYARTSTLDFSRSSIRIPLDKRINSFYDDFTLEVLFYDDVSTLKGKRAEYKKCKTFEERRKFIKENTEITHMGLAYIRNNKHVATIGLLGELNFNDPRITEADITLLPVKFSDFNNITLGDTNEIRNNDLRQFIQSKIDLDKEDSLEVVADKFIGNDNYKILMNTKVKVNANYDDYYYIRYICPSTGRIYFNVLNLGNLQLSEYFRKDNFESWIDAWWSLNNLGANPYNKAMIRC